MSETKKYFDANPTTEEVNNIKLITIKKTIAEAALKNKEFPEGTKTEVLTAYYRAAMDNYAQAQHDINEWWKLVIEKYKLPSDLVSFDFDIGRFYIMEK